MKLRGKETRSSLKFDFFNADENKAISTQEYKQRLSEFTGVRLHHVNEEMFQQLDMIYPGLTQFIERNYYETQYLGSGTYGAVFRAIKKASKSEVALKFVYPSKVLEEYDLLTRIHENSTCRINVPKPYLSHENKHFGCIEMELLGRNLLQLKLNKFQPKSVLMIGIQVLKVLKILYEESIVHRDIKPSNICVSLDNSRIHLIDFGLATNFFLAKESHLKYGHNGTLTYLSEACHKGCENNYNDDIESLFYVMLELLRGNLPWSKLRSEQDIQKSKSPKKIKELCRSFPFLKDFYNKILYMDRSEDPDYEKLLNVLQKEFASNYIANNLSQWNENTNFVDGFSYLNREDLRFLTYESIPRDKDCVLNIPQNLDKCHFYSSSKVNFDLVEMQLAYSGFSNNIKEKIQQSKRIHITENKINGNFLNIFSNIPTCTKELNRIVEKTVKNESRLPVHIKLSTVCCGEGLFGLIANPRMTLVGVYLGELTYELQKKSDSIFTIGTLKKEDLHSEILIDAGKYCNSSRYINCANIPEQANCKSILTIVNFGEYQGPAILIYTSRDTNPGEEYLYDYGQSYWGRNFDKEVIHEKSPEVLQKMAKRRERIQKTLFQKKVEELPEVKVVLSKTKFIEKIKETMTKRVEYNKQKIKKAEDMRAKKLEKNKK